MFIKKYLALAALSAIALSAHAEESKELKFLGRTIVHEDGSWVNPDEPKFKLAKPNTWFKRNYVRHYMQGSQEITDSIIKVDWAKLKEASKSLTRIIVCASLYPSLFTSSDIFFPFHFIKIFNSSI